MGDLHKGDCELDLEAKLCQTKRQEEALLAEETAKAKAQEQ